MGDVRWIGQSHRRCATIGVRRVTCIARRPSPVQAVRAAALQVGPPWLASPVVPMPVQGCVNVCLRCGACAVSRNSRYRSLAGFTAHCRRPTPSIALCVNRRPREGRLPFGRLWKTPSSSNSTPPTRTCRVIHLEDEALIVTRRECCLGAYGKRVGDGAELLKT